MALGILRLDLAVMRQDPDEPFHTFAACVQGKAETCEFKTTLIGHFSRYQTAVIGGVYCTDKVICDVLLNETF